MTFFNAIILGLIQGLAEFLPISSSGHLSLFQNFFGLQTAEQSNLFFDVLLHLGTLIAVVIYYWEDVRGMVVEFVKVCRELAGHRSSRPTPEANEQRRLILLVIVGTLPLFLVLPFKSKVEALYGHTGFIGLALLITGGLLWYADHAGRGRKTLRGVSLLDVLVVGLGQAIAVVPGLSRSGCSISAGLLRGMDRKAAVRYSFLLSLPAVAGANLLTLIDAVKGGLDMTYLPAYIVGVCVAAMSGYAAIGVINRLSVKGKFSMFAWYCWGAGVIALVLTGIFALLNR